MKNYLSILLVWIAILGFNAQTGVSVSPPRLYFEVEAGISATEKITITNVSAKNTLDLAVSLGDWEYDPVGENLTYPAKTLPASCASWISVKKEDAYVSLAPGEKKEIELTLTVPSGQTDNLQVHTSLLYVTQMNPVNDTDSKGASIKVSIRSGIKIFHKFPAVKNRKLEFTDLRYDAPKNTLTVMFSNSGEIWADGKLFTELINSRTGKKTVVDTIVFYTMPGNKRTVYVALPKDLEKGEYTASVILDYGDADNLEVGELNFKL